MTQNRKLQNPLTTSCKQHRCRLTIVFKSLQHVHVSADSIQQLRWLGYFCCLWVVHHHTNQCPENTAVTVWVYWRSTSSYQPAPCKHSSYSLGLLEEYIIILTSTLKTQQLQFGSTGGVHHHTNQCPENTTVTVWAYWKSTLSQITSAMKTKQSQSGSTGGVHHHTNQHNENTAIIIWGYWRSTSSYQPEQWKHSSHSLGLLKSTSSYRPTQWKHSSHSLGLLEQYIIIPTSAMKTQQSPPKPFFTYDTWQTLLCTVQSPWWRGHSCPHSATQWLVTLWCHWLVLQVWMCRKQKQKLPALTVKAFTALREHQHMLWVPSDPRCMNQNKRRDMFLRLPLLKCVRVATTRESHQKPSQFTHLLKCVRVAITRESHQKLHNSLTCWSV